MKLKKNIKFSRIFIIVFSTLPIIALSACEGRKSSNMVPTGDTVEVVIMQPVTPEKSSTDTLTVKI